tara:strand:+ start:242 stop:436 length:195 start_codon:yes stop_codon:yes gene_type:complete
MHEPWEVKKSLLEITADRGAKGLEPIDMGYMYLFKNHEAKHFLNDEEALKFYEQHKEELDKEPE